MVKRPIYLDYNATTPCDPSVVEIMLPYFTEHFGNAASYDHAYGWFAKESVEAARVQVADLIGAKAKEITFTSGATESINLAIKGIAEAGKAKGDHIITSKAEHKAVLDTCAYLEEKGFSVSYLDVNAEGSLSIDLLEEKITEQTICFVFMYANNETGVINPVTAIGRTARKHGIPFICDATQAAGKLPIDVNAAGLDLMAFSAHKMYGPKGVGALYIRNREPKIRLVSQQQGGGHERGNRSGTLNTAGIIGFAKAAALCMKEMKSEAKRLGELRDYLEEQLLEAIPGTFVNGGGNRLAHVTNICFPHIDSEQLLLALSKDLAMSRGSACAGNIQQPSHVLLALGLNPAEAQNAIRISLGRFTTNEEVEHTIELLKDGVRRFQNKRDVNVEVC